MHVRDIERIGDIIYLREREREKERERAVRFLYRATPNATQEIRL